MRLPVSNNDRIWANEHARGLTNSFEIHERGVQVSGVDAGEPRIQITSVSWTTTQGMQRMQLTGPGPFVSPARPIMSPPLRRRSSPSPD
jgi:hypothetical protein